ncbi:MAG TPA: hypothetical protein VJ872_07195 [Nocardioides sp.]|nr:hypothetical protein [Nocardioides sp.]
MTRAPLQTDRRAALRSLACAALVVPLISACDATDTTQGRSTGVRPTAGSAAADAALVDVLAQQIAGLRVAATAVAKRSPRRRSWALDLASMHQQHLRKLGATTAHAAPSVARTPAALAAAEGVVRDALVSAAGRAESGALAQVLASMAAAIEQRLVRA